MMHWRRTMYHAIGEDDLTTIATQMLGQTLTIEVALTSPIAQGTSANFLLY